MTYYYYWGTDFMGEERILSTPIGERKNNTLWKVDIV